MSRALPSLALWLDDILNRFGSTIREARRAARQLRRAPSRLIVERLEDRCLLSTTLVPISLPPGSQPPSATAAGPSISPSVSDDGNFVAFESDAPNVVPGQTGGDHRNVFLLNRGTGQVTLVSHIGAPGDDTVAPSDADSWNPIISGNGQYVIYETWASEVVNGLAPFQFYKPNAVVWDRLTDTTTIVSHAASSLTQAGDLDTNPEAISDNGRYIVFQSTSTDIVPNQVEGPVQTPSAPDWQYYLYDQQNPGATQMITHSTAGVNVTSNGYLGFVNTVTDAGVVAYTTEGNNIVAGATNWGIYIYTPGVGNQLITPADGGVGYMAEVSADGSAVAYEYNLNIYRYDRQTDVTTLLSHAAGLPTTPANAGSGGDWGWGLAVSSTGQYVVFASDATNLIMGQGGSGRNLYRYNAATGTLALLSGVDGSPTVGAGGVVASASDSIPSLSADGSQIAYVSTATDLLPFQASTGPSGTENLFLYNGLTGQTALVSGADGSPTAGGDANSSTPGFSADGSVLVFQSQADNLLGTGVLDGNGVDDIFTYTPAVATIALVSAAAFRPAPMLGDSFSTSVSADGTYTVFVSTATDLVPNQVNPHSAATVNVFLYDKDTNTVALVNHAPGVPNTSGDGGLNYKGQPDDQAPISALQPVISADGSTIAFTSYDNNLVSGEDQNETNQPPWEAINHACVYLYNTATGRITLVNSVPGVSDSINEYASSPAISANGDYVAYVYGDSSPIQGTGPIDEGVGGIALYDSLTGVTTNVTSLDASGNGDASDPTISDDGRYVAYLNQGDVYVFDSNSGVTTLVSHEAQSPSIPANAGSTQAVISHDGDSIVFVSTASNLVSGQASSGSSGLSNVFLYNVASGAVSLVSGVNGSAWLTGDGNSDSPAIDGAGDYVAYRSDANNLVPGLSGPTGNVFEFDSQTNAQILVSHQAGTSLAAGGSTDPVIDEDGHLVSYVSSAGDLVTGQTGTTGVHNIIIWLRQTGANMLVSGQDGSPTVGGNADSSGPLLTRDSYPGFSSTATNLSLSGYNPGQGGGQGGGGSVVYINTLVSAALSSNTLPDNTPAGTALTIIIPGLPAGTFLTPTFTLEPPTAGNNDADFQLVGNLLILNFNANYAIQNTYIISIGISGTGLQDTVDSLTLGIAPPVQTEINPPLRPIFVLNADGSLTEQAPALDGGSRLLSPNGTIVAIGAVQAQLGDVLFAVTTFGPDNLWEYNTAQPMKPWTRVSPGSFQQISATTNVFGDAVAFGVLGPSAGPYANSLWEYNPDNRAAWIQLSPGGTILSVSATSTVSGETAFAISSWGDTLWQYKTTGLPSWTQLSTGSFTQISAGLNSSGQAVVYGIVQGGSLWEQNPANGTGLNRGWTLLSPTGTILSLSAGAADRVVAIAAGNTLWMHSDAGWTELSHGSFGDVSASPTATNDDLFATLTDGDLWEYTDGSAWRWLLQGDDGLASAP